MRLFSYKMTNDSGFAPNPFGHTLTFATCKPEIRQCILVGDWIAGFTSWKLAGHEVGSERLIYLMRVAEKLPVRDYFSDSRFQDKIPDMSARGPMAKAGDNIYRPLRPDADDWTDFEQLPNPNHWNGDRPNEEDRLILTDPDTGSLTRWRLPPGFYPDAGKPPLSYHRTPERWRRGDGYCTVRSASRGQEFVLDTVRYPGVTDWLSELLAERALDQRVRSSSRRW